jgi:formamidase
VRALSIAGLQIAPVVRDRGATLRSFEQRLRGLRATIDHVELVILPELHLSAPPGLLEEGDSYAAEAAEPIPGPLTDRLCELALETGLWLVPGSIYERAGDGGIHNTAVAISPSGELVARYRKAFPWQPYERTEPGERFTVFDLPGIGRAGLAICYDGFFPETFRQLAWLGAEIVFHPTLTTTSDRPAELIAARANAIFNQLYVFNVNASSPAALGRSLVVDPDGVVRYEAGSGEELITAVLDLDAAERTRRFGTGAVSRMWQQLDSGAASDLELPMYADGRIQPRPKPDRRPT